MENRDLEYVGFWLRVAASIIDTVLLLLVTYPVLLAIYGATYFNEATLIHGPVDFLHSWVFPAVAVIWFWVARGGQTPGKMVIGAKIVDAETGGPISASKGVVRYLGYFVSLIGLFVGYLWVGFDPKKQGWHDHIAGTVVVRKKTAVVFGGS